MVFSFFIYFGLVPILLLLFKDKFNKSIQNSKHEMFIYGSSDLDFIYAYLLIIVGFISFHIFYKLTINKNITLKSNFNYTNKNKIKYSYEKVLKTIEIFGYLTFFIGIFSMLILIYSSGGIFNLIAIGEKFRGFDNENSLASFIGRIPALFMIPARFITVAPVLFYFLILNRRKPVEYIFFAISIFFALIFFLFNAGRAPLILFLIIFIYIYLEKRSKRPWLLIFFIGVILLPILDLLDVIFIFLATGNLIEIEISYISYVEQFIHPFRNLLNIKEFVNLNEFQYGQSIIKEFLSILPGIGFTPIYYNISEFFNGYNWKSGIPTDIITYGYYQFGIIGVIIFMSIVGIFSSFLDKTLKSLPLNNSKKFFSVALATSIFPIVAYVDFSAIIKSNLIFVVICIILYFISKTRLLK